MQCADGKCEGIAFGRGPRAADLRKSVQHVNITIYADPSLAYEEAESYINTQQSNRCKTSLLVYRGGARSAFCGPVRTNPVFSELVAADTKDFTVADRSNRRNASAISVAMGLPEMLRYSRSVSGTHSVS